MKKGDFQTKLAIITPYYNTLEYTQRLAEVLKPQLTDEVEWFIIDDGCNEDKLDNLPATIIHLKENSGGASIPRNIGLDFANSEYITFIDSDDMVTNDYIQTILDKINTEYFDYCYFGWSSPSFFVEINEEPPKWNCSVWNCVYNSKQIGEERFNPDIVIGEDYDFNLRVKKGVRKNINKILYYYNDTPNSLMKRATNEQIQ